MFPVNLRDGQARSICLSEIKDAQEAPQVEDRLMIETVSSGNLNLPHGTG